MVALSVMFYEPTRGAFPKQPRNSLLNDHSTMHRTNYLVTTVSRKHSNFVAHSSFEPCWFNNIVDDVTWEVKY